MVGITRACRAGIGAGAALLALVTAWPTLALDALTIGTSKPASAEQGGYYAAIASGSYRKYGLDVTIRRLEPGTDPAGLLVTGEIDFSIDGNSFEQVELVTNDVPVVSVAAIFQKDPIAVLAHPGAGISRLEDLRGRTLFLTDQSQRTLWPWLQERYDLSEGQLRPHPGDPGPFLAEPASVLVGDVIAETFALATRSGIEPVVLLPANDVYYTYNGTVQASSRLVHDEPELVQRFVDATIEGWYRYIYDENARGRQHHRGRGGRHDRRHPVPHDRPAAGERHRLADQRRCRGVRPPLPREPRQEGLIARAKPDRARLCARPQRRATNRAKPEAGAGQARAGKPGVGHAAQELSPAGRPRGRAGAGRGFGPRQDGALLVRFADRWVAVFLAFQTQSWNTDAAGQPIGAGPEPRPPTGRDPNRDALVQIVAAMVNAPGTEAGGETVRLLNRSDAEILLDGWAILDDEGRASPLTAGIAAGEARRIRLPGSAGTALLANKGGEIVLRASDGTTIHRVAYAKADVGPDGWTVLF